MVSVYTVFKQGEDTSTLCLLANKPQDWKSKALLRFLSRLGNREAPCEFHVRDIVQIVDKSKEKPK